jgi:hypothetical protein
LSRRSSPARQRFHDAVGLALAKEGVDRYGPFGNDSHDPRSIKKRAQRLPARREPTLPGGLRSV